MTHDHADHESCGMNCPIGGADGAQHQVTIQDVTLCTVEPFTEDEVKALNAYFSMLRKAKDRKRGIKNLDVPQDGDGG